MDFAFHSECHDQRSDESNDGAKETNIEKRSRRHTKLSFFATRSHFFSLTLWRFLTLILVLLLNYASYLLFLECVFSSTLEMCESKLVWLKMIINKNRIYTFSSFVDIRCRDIRSNQNAHSNDGEYEHNANNKRIDAVTLRRQLQQ